MITRNAERTVLSKQMFDGAGQVEMHAIRSGSDELYNKGRLFAHVILNQGCEIGWHIHHGDGEVYYMLSGTAEYNDNGTMTTVSAGDVTFCDDGEGHSLRNNGDEPVEIIALVLYK